MLRKLWKRPASAAAEPAVPAGQRIYAIGDIHGRFDLLERLLAMIATDGADRGDADTILVFLGDLIDRGPDSALVVERLRRLAIDQPMSHFLMGNHEEVFLAALGGDQQALKGFCRMGGRDTAISYGIKPAAYDRMDYRELAAALDALVPASHLAFLASFEDAVTIGDYLFVHAGVDPAEPLDAQRPRCLRWIREPFLEHPARLDKLVVHGHTIRPEVERRVHRIGIDTGGYQTGCLTALGLEGTTQWTLNT